jgi:hypothetical protein
MKKEEMSICMSKSCVRSCVCVRVENRRKEQAGLGEEGDESDVGIDVDEGNQSNISQRGQQRDIKDKDRVMSYL